MSSPQPKTPIEQYNKILDLYNGDILRYGALEQDLLDLAKQIYKDGPKEGLECGINMVRVLDSIKRLNPNGNTVTYDNILIEIIRNAVRTGCYSDGKSNEFSTKINILAELKQSNNPLFEKYVDEILKIEVSPENPKDFKIVLHSGFQKRVLGIRPGPSPIASDTDGVFICKLRKAIIDFLEYYGIKNEKSDRFTQFNNDCKTAVASSSLRRQGGGYKRNKTKRNRKAYKTIRRNNKNKNKKQYRRKRHTKKYKKSHRKSRR